MIELKAKVSAHVQSANTLSLCCDIWSKKGLSSSYLGITAHFFSRNDCRRHTATLAVRRLTSSHTATNIRQVIDDILTEWDIDSAKVCAILTDNGSNMVAAFKARFEEVDDDIEELTEPCTADDVEDFLDREMDHDVEFCSFKRISCFSHTLQLVVSKYDQLDTFEELMKRAHAIVRKVNSSTKATEKLIALCGKKLVKDCPTNILDD